MPAPETCVTATMMRELGAEGLLRKVGEAGGLYGFVDKYGGAVSSLSRYVRRARKETGLDWRDFVPEKETVPQMRETEMWDPSLDLGETQPLPDDPPPKSSVNFERFVGGDDLAEVREQYLRLTGRDEQVYRVKLEPEAGQDFARIVNMADLHHGTADCDYPRFLRMVRWVGEHPGVRIVGVGDWFDTATLQSPGGSIGKQALSIEQSVAMLHEDLWPVRDRIVGLLIGNHEQRIARATGVPMDPVRWLCERLQVPYLGYECPIEFTIGDQTYLIYYHHGTGSGQTLGAVMNTLQRLGVHNRCDAVVMGHRHQRVAYEWSFKTARDGMWVTETCQLVCAGSYQRHQHGSYAVDKAYAPSVPGSATLFLHADRHAVSVRD